MVAFWRAIALSTVALQRVCAEIHRFSAFANLLDSGFRRKDKGRSTRKTRLGYSREGADATFEGPVIPAKAGIQVGDLRIDNVIDWGIGPAPVRKMRLGD